MKNHFEPHTKKLADESLSNITGELMQLYVVRPVAKPITDFNEYSDMDINDFSEGDADENGEFSNVFGKGRRKACKAKGLKGKAFRDCVKELTKEDKGLSKSERKEKKKLRKEEFNKAIIEGKVEKGKNIRKLQKFNPAAVALRGTFITALRFNIFGVATRLYPALLTVEEAKAKNFDIENLPKAKKALEKVYALYIKIGGDPNKMLKNVIVKAHDKPIFNTKKAKARKTAEEKKGFDGSSEKYSNLTEEAIVAISTSSAGVLASIIALVGAKKNPYKDGSPQAKAFDTTATQAPPVSPQYAKLIKDAEIAASADRAKGLPLDSGDDTMNTDKKFLGMPKGVAIGLGALLVVGLIWGGYKLIKGKKIPITT